MKNVLVATDGSVLSDRALARAIELARQAGAKLTILNVVDLKPVSEAVRRFVAVEGSDTQPQAAMPLPLPDSFGLSSVGALEDLDSRSRAVAQLVSDRVLDKARKAAVSAGISDVETVSAGGDAAREIVATAKAIGADLVVVGKRGLSGVNELLLGSVSQKVLHHSPTDVLIAA